MKFFKNAAQWISSQFKTHTTRSVLITAAAAAVIAAGTLLIVWPFGRDASDDFTYFPNRAYILADTEPKEPQTLKELLHSDEPGIDTLLKNSYIAKELLAAEKLTDIVDSRLALNNLRELDNQLSERLSEAEEEGIDILDMPEIIPEETAPPSTGADTNVPDTSVPPSTEGQSSTPPSTQPPADTSSTSSKVETTSPVTTSPAATEGSSAEPPSTDTTQPPADTNMSATIPAAKAYASQISLLKSLYAVTQNLLKPNMDAEAVEFDPSFNMKGVWQNPGEVLLHMTPSGDWVPAEGYLLYRIIDEKRELIKDNVASTAKGMSGAINVKGYEIDDEEEYEKYKDKNVNLIQDLYNQAELTQGKLKIMGMASAEEFRKTLYRANINETIQMVSGKIDFERMRERSITIPANFEQRIPDTDLLLGNTVYILNKPQNSTLMSSSIQSSLLKKHSVLSFTPISGLSELEGKTSFSQAYEIFSARQQIISLGFVDEDFAEEAGFLVTDELSELNLNDGAKITYHVETKDGTVLGRLFLENGKATDLSKPQGLMGYGMDGKVPLRWDIAESEAERSIISGYIIERKFKNEKNFTRINKEPVVIAHALDESGVYFESPAFYQDEVEDGEVVAYRICSLDVFGRMSEYSDTIEFNVEKVTPPNSPTVAKMTLSGTEEGEDVNTTDSSESNSVDTEQSIEANAGKKGIILPIYTDSPDTVRFTIYRAVAVGAQGFGPPEVLSNIKYDNPAPPTEAEEDLQNEQNKPTVNQLEEKKGKLTIDGKPVIKETKINQAIQILLTEEVVGYPNLTFFDADIEEGCTYKYWVSAWDSWNNESAWSQSVTMVVPTEKEPKSPGELDAHMLARELTDLGALPPGVVVNPLVSYEDLEKESDPRRPYATNIDTHTVKAADTANIKFGGFDANVFPKLLTSKYDNLPEEKYIHMFLGVRGEDVLPDGTARLKWPAYSGDGLEGYMVYRPLFVPDPIEEMQKMTRNELVQKGSWQLVNPNNAPTTANQLVVGGLDSTPGKIHLFLVCLKPEFSDTDFINFDFKYINMDLIRPNASNSENPFAPFEEAPKSGYVDLSWEAPEDPLVQFYRIYRCEMTREEYNKGPDTDQLEWTLIGDYVKATKYTDPVEQSFAHYYYYKVTSVSPWSIESPVGAISNIRVPSTKPPETPNMLLPLSRKDGVQVNFASVNHCDWYEIYRAEIPKPSDKQLADMMSVYESLAKVLFDSPSKNDFFLTEILADSTNPILWKNIFGGIVTNPPKQGTSANSANQAAETPPPIAESAPIMALQKFKTIAQLDDGQLQARLSALDANSSLKAYKNILDELGPLALADYADLSLPLLKLVPWTKIGTVPASEQEVDPTGLLKPLSFMDETAQYGSNYLYSVQAWNDDNLGSMRPEPVEASPRRNGPFDPIQGLTGEIVDLFPSLRWNAPKMKNLTAEQCREDTVGYVVYRSDKKDGNYYQASPLLFEREWIDKDADLYAFNWYRVKVLDTGGYFSEFSEEFLVKGPFATELETEIPDISEKIKPPEIALAGTSFTIFKGAVFSTTYELDGTEPIEVTLKAVDNSGNPVTGFALNTAEQKVSAQNTLGVGNYTVTLTAKNGGGEDSKTFRLEVKLPPIIVPPVLTLEASRFLIREGEPFETTYGLTGTEPITVTLKVEGPDGELMPGLFNVNTSTRKITAGPDLYPITYLVTVTAKNSAGQSSKSFYLTVERPIGPTAPKLEAREDEYKFLMFRTKDFSIQFFATGSWPMTWSLKSLSIFLPVPSEISIDNDGLLKVDGSIAVGDYSFYIRVENSAGVDMKVVSLKVLFFIDPIGPPFYAGGIDPGTSPRTLSAPQISTSDPVSAIPVVDTTVETYKSERMRCGSFFLFDVELSRPLGPIILYMGYSGTARLKIGEELIPVRIIGGEIEKSSGGTALDTLISGAVYIEESVEIPDIGLTLVSLEISPDENKAEVSGYIKNPDENKNVLGNRYAIEFKRAELRPGYIIVRRGVPSIRYEQFTISGSEELWISTAAKGTFEEGELFNFVGGNVEIKSHLETLDNKDLRFKLFSLSFNYEGQMSADLMLDGEQALRLLVPGGSALRVEDAFLVIRKDVPQSNSYLLGKLVLPFERAGLDDKDPGVPGTYAGAHPETNDYDALANLPGADALQSLPFLSDTLKDALIKFGERAQQNGLLVVPDDFELQDKCSSVSIEIHGWSGAGFTVDSAEMTPANMAERSLSVSQQRKQGVVITPTTVSVDLDRDSFVEEEAPATDEKIMTPKETKEPFWVGLVMHGGKVALPPAYVQKSGGGKIEFALARGEMIYDLNGFNYQTYLYSTEGVPANFGPALGGFTDVWVYDCLLDLYANKINLEINAEVAVDLFRGERVDAKIYTNKKDNKDGKMGELLCSVAPTIIKGVPSAGIDLTVDGGWFREDGMHISGSITIDLDQVKTGEETMDFNDLVVPADIKKSGAMSKFNRKYSSVELDRPINVNFQGFTMEIRALDMTFRDHPSHNVMNGSIDLNLHGATLLAENIPLASDTLDILRVDCPIGLADPGVLYEESYSVLKTSFDGCVDVGGVMVPEWLPTHEDGLVEFDTEKMNLSFLSQLEAIQVKVSARFGFDLNNKRCYFALGVATGPTIQITFGAGKLKDFAGLVSYNMIAERDKLQRLKIPSYGGLVDFIKDMKVDREGGSGFVAGISATLVITELCEIRNLYFAFQSGPIVDAGGDLYLPLNVAAMVGDDSAGAESAFTKIASVAIIYRHPEKYFSFTIAIDFNVIMAQVKGNIGFEYSPALFGVYLGYPELLGGRFGWMHAKVGVGYIAESGEQKLIRAIAEYGYDIVADIHIVYIRGFIYAGAQGDYRFGGDKENRIELKVYVKGGLEGGIRAMGRKYNIISLRLNAEGTMISSKPYKTWDVEAKCKVTYSLNVWIHTFEGSVSAELGTTISAK